MIVKMKKVSLVVQLSARERALNSLGGAGVFHTGRVEGHGELLNDLYVEQSHLMQSISFLPVGVKENQKSTISSTDLSIKIAKTFEAIKGIEEKISIAEKEIARIIHWPSFSPLDIERLIQEGLYVNLYEVRKKDFSTFNRCNAAVYEVGRGKGMLLLVVITANQNDIPLEEPFDLPTHSIYELKSLIDQSVTEKRKITEELALLSRDAQVIKKRIHELDNEITFEKTCSSMTEHGDLTLLEGYIPLKAVPSFKKLVATEGWGAIYSDPLDGEEEEVPTLTKQYGLGRFVSPVLKMLDLTPGYKEFDITSVMFFFFSIFFAMIIGDGGYGLIFLVGGIGFIISKLMTGKAITAGNIYFSWLGFCTVVWGAITGSWFGVESFKEVPFLAQFVISDLGDPLFVQKLTFIIGTIHLSIAHLWAAIRHLRTNPLVAIADLGNLSMVVGLYYLVLMLLLGGTAVVVNDLPGGNLPSWVLPMVGGGFLAVLLFGGQEKGINPVKAALIGLANFFPAFLSSIGNFSDIISYIRLYAVGLAGLAIAQSFNGMALSMGSPLITIIILLAAHSLNIALAMLSIVVHGLRLNSLEFSNHLGLQWSGNPYVPFVAQRKKILN